MNRPIIRSLKQWVSHPLLSATLVVCLTFCSAGCVVSLAPAYRIIKESREIQFVPGQIPELRVRASYTLENYGNSELASIDVVLPDKGRYGLKNLIVRINGRETTRVESSKASQAEEGTALRVPFDPAWNQKQRRDLVIEYVLASPEDSGINIALSATSFHVVSRGWFPSLQPPKHVLSSYPDEPERTPFSVRVPADFLVLAAGKPAGRKKNSAEVEYKFELRKSDFAPYVVAGRYVESPSNPRSSEAVFWTLQPLKESASQAGQQIAATSSILQKDFGPAEKSAFVPHVVESSGLQVHLGGDDSPAAVSFPGGVLVSSQAVARGIDSNDFLKLATSAVARNWFLNQIYFSPDSPVGLAEGLAEYSKVVIDETEGGESLRRERVSKFLREYDDALKQAVEKPIIATAMSDPIEQRRIAAAKAPLFFIALEDAYGEESVRKGLAQVVRLLRGQQVGFQDIRAALENVTNKDPMPMFRIWLYQAGIPAEFREKYQGTTAGKN